MSFDSMLMKAKSALSEVTPLPGSKPGSKLPQVTVLLTDQDNVYLTNQDEENELIDKLKAKNDTKILKMVSMWMGGQVDLSSMDFRKSICEMNKDNLETEILLCSKPQGILPAEYHTRTLKSTMKQKT
jgi:hypothetical protein